MKMSLVEAESWIWGIPLRRLAQADSEAIDPLVGRWRDREEVIKKSGSLEGARQQPLEVPGAT